MVWAWLGGGAVTQFLGGVSAQAQRRWPLPWSRELLGESREEEKGGLGLLAWLEYALSQGCWNLFSGDTEVLLGAEREGIPDGQGVGRVSLWSLWIKVLTARVSKEFEYGLWSLLLKKRMPLLTHFY